VNGNQMGLRLSQITEEAEMKAKTGKCIRNNTLPLNLEDWGLKSMWQTRRCERGEADRVLLV